MVFTCDLRARGGVHHSKAHDRTDTSRSAALRLLQVMRINGQMARALCMCACARSPSSCERAHMLCCRRSSVTCSRLLLPSSDSPSSFTSRLALLNRPPHPIEGRHDEANADQKSILSTRRNRRDCADRQQDNYLTESGGSRGVQQWQQRVPYETYRSPYGPQ